MGITQTLTRLVPSTCAKELTFTAAARLRRGGRASSALRHRACADDPLAAAQELAAEIAGERSPDAVPRAQAPLRGDLAARRPSGRAASWRPSCRSRPDRLAQPARGRACPGMKGEPREASATRGEPDRPAVGPRGPESDGCQSTGPATSVWLPQRAAEHVARRARRSSSSASRSTPVAIAHLVEHRDEVLGGDVAGRARRAPGSRRARRSSTRSCRTPASSAASTLARPWPRVLWKCAVSSTPSPSASRARREELAHLARVGHAGRVAEADLLRRRRRAAGAAIVEHALGRHVALVGAAEATSRSRPRSAAPPRARAAEHPLQPGQRLLDRAVDVLAVVGLAAPRKQLTSLEALAQRERVVQPALVGDQHA